MEDMLVVRKMEPKDVICTMIDILLAGIDTVSIALNTMVNTADVCVL